MILRSYQREAADAVFREWGQVGSTLVVMPTGTGKTILMASVIQRVFPQRAMVLAHREELIFQAKDKIERVTGLTTEVEMADLRSPSEYGLFRQAPVIVSTIQTQAAGGDGRGRMGRFDPMRFGLLVVDEAHHATASSYRRVIDYYRTNPNLRLLGVTATPDRADEEALGQVYETVAFDYEILNAISDGWLVPIQQQMVSVEGLDFSQVRTTAGDLNGADLAAVMQLEKNLHGIADPTVKIAGSRRTLVFTASVVQAERLSEILNRHRPGRAAWICGKTDKDERRKVLRDFAAGEIQFVVNVGCLTEGFDDPGVEVIVMGRPTKSRSLYAQMAGRATRPLPGVVDGLDSAAERVAAIAASAKSGCLIVDFVGNSGRHKLMTTADILGGKVSDEAVARAVARVRATGEPVDMATALSEEEKALRAERERRRAEEAARRSHLVVGARFGTRSVDPFDAFQISPAGERGCDRGKVLTDRQRKLLLNQGFDPDQLRYGQACQLISEIIRRFDGRLCTFKQAMTLRKYGYSTEVSKKEATEIINRIAAAGWRRPAEEMAHAGSPA